MSRKKQAKGAPGADADALRLTAHPRAQRSIRRIRAASGLLGLLLVLVLSLRAGLPPFDATLRALESSH